MSRTIGMVMRVLPLLVAATVEVLGAGCTNVGGGASNGGTGTGGSGGSGGSGGAPGCGPDKPCAADEYCFYADKSCGANGESTGVCKKRPTTCTLAVWDVCGCDHNVYQGVNPDCVAKDWGIDVGDAKPCVPDDPDDPFACGTYLCYKNWVYVCLIQGTDPPRCEPAGVMNDNCVGNTQSCATCSSDPKCTCSGDASTGITITCP
jgi:hypothetical protein